MHICWQLPSCANVRLCETQASGYMVRVTEPRYTIGRLSKSVGANNVFAGILYARARWKMLGGDFTERKRKFYLAINLGDSVHAHLLYRTLANLIRWLFRYVMVPSFRAGWEGVGHARGSIEKSLYMVFCDRFATLHIRKTRRYVIRDTRCTTWFIQKPLSEQVFFGESL